MNTYKLVKNVINTKAAKYHYQVVDQTGTVISERKTSRDYVAATIDGSFYFGRLDLIGKASHGDAIKMEEGFTKDWDQRKRKWFWVKKWEAGQNPYAKSKENLTVAYLETI